MTNKAVYLQGIKQWMPFSPFAQEDPYCTFRRAMGLGLYSVDMDERFISVQNGIPTTVAYIERECSPERIRRPLAYLQSFWHESPMRLKLSSLTRDAQKLGIPAYFVAHSADLQQFIVVRLPWNGTTYQEYTANQYKQFLTWLAKPETQEKSA